MVSLEVKFNFDSLRQELHHAFTPVFGLAMDIAAFVSYASGWVPEEQRILQKIPASLASVSDRHVMQDHWSRLLRRVREPVETLQLKCGLRAVQVLGHNVFVFFPNGCIASYTWEFKQDQGATLVPVSAGTVALDGAYYVKAWLFRLAELAKYEIAQHRGADIQDSQAFAHWQFDVFKRKLKVEADLGWMRVRIRQALRLDAAVAEIARNTISPFGLSGSLTVQQYNYAQRNKAEHSRVAKESPHILPLYALCSTNPHFPKSGEPFSRLKSYLRAAGLSDRGWRMALTMRKTDFNFVHEFYHGNLCDAVVDYLVVRDSIGLHGFQPRWLLASAYSLYGTSSRRRNAYQKAMNDDHFIVNLAHVVRLYQGNQLGIQDLRDDRLLPVLDWLCSSHIKPLTRKQRQQGMGLLVAKAQAWLTEMEVKAGASQAKWVVPFAERHIGTYKLIALRNAYELWQEGKRMGHCVGDYTKRCLTGTTLIFSVMHGAKPVATAEFKLHSSGWALASALGPSNTRLPQNLLNTLKASAVHLKDFSPVNNPQKENL